MKTTMPRTHFIHPLSGMGAPVLLLAIALTCGASSLSARPKTPPPAPVPLSAAGEKAEARYSTELATLKAEISAALPTVDEKALVTLGSIREDLRQAQAQADAAQAELNKIGAANGSVAHAKGKWIGGADKGIAAAEAALKKATTDAEREAAKTDLATWQANKEEGLKALKERQAAYDKIKASEPELKKASDAAKAAFDKSSAQEKEAVKAVFSKLDPFLSSNKLDAKLIRAALLARATPGGLAEFAQQGSAQESLVDKLLADEALMKEMLVAGGAKYDRFGTAMEIYTSIQRASDKAKSGHLQRLALATALEHAKPVTDNTSSTSVIDPVKRYLHYEKAFLDDELDPAFENFTTWEYRMVVNSNAPDEILTWGRQMLRNYRPDHIRRADYGWRYVEAVKTEVPYGSQNVKFDDPAQNQYQNIAKNGGVCGRRAFFGRFILQSFGIPTWGVTQKAHAALSHWTPQGWVVNLGAGFQHSWWDKDEVPMSGDDFLLETQARRHEANYPKVLRARWISSILGEQAYNGRKKIAGGFWSVTALDQARILAAQEVTLGPLGQELAEANEREEKKKVVHASVTDADRQAIVGKDGIITLPAVAFEKPSGKYSVMQGFPDGMQLHCFGGYSASYEIDAPAAGTYTLTVRVATVQEGQKLLISANDSSPPSETAVPYTLGMWQHTAPVELSLNKGRNVIQLGLKEGSRGVSIKDLSLKAVK